jgi:tripartite-type tricarboxylate transporter receptor subunit TctC
MFRSSHPVRVLACSAALLLGAALHALAQTYPAQTVKIVVPFPAGGGIDMIARVIAPKLSEALGQSVIVENRAGAGGSLAATAVAKAPADGYTVLLGTGSTHGTNAVVYSKLGYDPTRDFAPIVPVATSPLMLVTHPSVPAKSVKELIELARSKPDELKYSSFGTGGLNHLAGELFSARAQIKTIHVPYRGTAPAMNDLIAGQVQYSFESVQASIAHIQAGTIRLLAAAGDERATLLPDAPTVSESGVPGFAAISWSGIFAPAGTPKQVVELLNGKMNPILASPEVKASLAKLGVDTLGGSPDKLAGMVEAEIRKWTDIARERNIRIEP